MIHDSKRLLKQLDDMIRCSVTGASFVVSGVKRGGAVHIRFRSTAERDGSSQAREFFRALCRAQVEVVMVDECRLRIVLDHLRVTGVAPSEPSDE